MTCAVPLDACACVVLHAIIQWLTGFQQVYSQDACENITTNDLGNLDTLSLGGLDLSSFLTPSKL